MRCRRRRFRLPGTAGCAQSVGRRVSHGWRPTEIVAERDRAAVRLRRTGRHDGELCGIAPTGGLIAYYAAAFFRSRDGRLCAAWCSGMLTGCALSSAWPDVADPLAAGARRRACEQAPDAAPSGRALAASEPDRRPGRAQTGHRIAPDTARWVPRFLAPRASPSASASGGGVAYIGAAATSSFAEARPRPGQLSGRGNRI